MSDTPKYIKPTIAPGSHKAKINSFELRPKPFKNNKGNPIFDVCINLETSPITAPNFKGFKKDFNDPNSEIYLGQVGRVRISEYGFSDSELEDGTQISGEKDALRGIKSLCTEIGQLSWFQQQDEKLPTCEALIKEINSSGIFKDHYLYFCIGSKQYVNTKGYQQEDLYLPKYKSTIGKPFSKTVEDLIPFSSTTHIMKPKNAATAGKGAGQTSAEFPKDENPMNVNTTFTGSADDMEELPF